LCFGTTPPSLELWSPAGPPPCASWLARSISPLHHRRN